MALEHAILVSLTERTGSGYELARRFDRSIGYFWPATHQQIYRVLRRMDDAGWVTHTEVAQDGRPDKKVYEVSDAGRDELVRWLAEPVEPAVLRDGLGVKLRGASLGDTDAVLREVERHRGEHSVRLEVYRGIERRDFPKPSELTGRELHQYLVLRGGIRAEESFVAWCDEVLQALSPSTKSSEASRSERTR
ncbi:DNA-binding PadR family transcriptional regulator [Kribbella orskensis]|uniref:DNA-binding PadR family transcriptional regulator n=1 Tax=Kribbella orskensis TaxID=2512216 RepID=A0ABY2B858_9ACTN|nr:MULTISPECIES: PadR family transcriptional regulator [Kribbella]TCN30510.1 DNA-binding PadR family transcriptional regulator [Kribbella sp. VKM Ac-2500]TCO11152.1 DNA-binding PadR family transcriptional regulator [Kribbella orskensis]